MASLPGRPPDLWIRQDLQHWLDALPKARKKRSWQLILDRRDGLEARPVIVTRSLNRRCDTDGKAARVDAKHQSRGSLLAVANFALSGYFLDHWRSQQTAEVQLVNPLQFETRSLPALSRSYPRYFTFYVAHPFVPFSG